MARYSNASGTPTMAAQNAVFGPVRARLDRRTGGVTLASGATNHANCALSLQMGPTADGPWVDVDLINPDDAGGAVIEGITGPDKAGTAPLNASSAEWFRVIRTDANAGACPLFLTIQ